MSGSNAPRPPWTAAQLALLRDLYPHQHTQAVAAAIGRPAHAVYRKASALGLHKSREWIAQVARERTTAPGHGSHAARFQKGHSTWNKGRPGSTGRHPNTQANHFRPGTCNGRAAQLVLPVGTLRISADGLLQRKIGTAPGAPHKRWHAVHRLVWEAACGPVPPGHLVVFRPGCRTTVLDEITLDRVELVTRAENMRRNSFRAQLPPELHGLVQLRGALQRQINRKTKKAAEQAEAT